MSLNCGLTNKLPQLSTSLHTDMFCIPITNYSSDVVVSDTLFKVIIT